MNRINSKNSSNAVSNIKNITHLKLSVLLSSILLMLAFAFFIYASFNPKDTAASSKKPVYSDSVPILVLILVRIPIPILALILVITLVLVRMV